MSSPYPRINHWVVPGSTITATLAGVRPASRRGCESGAFWLGIRAATARVTTVVLPAGQGVVESPGHWQVGLDVFGEISRWAKPRGLTLLGIAHTHLHGVPPRLSWADRQQSVRVPGLLAVVVADGGDVEDYVEWGWYVYEDGDYRKLDVPELARRVGTDLDEQVEVWRADSGGVWPLTSSTANC